MKHKCVKNISPLSLSYHHHHSFVQWLHAGLRMLLLVTLMVVLDLEAELCHGKRMRSGAAMGAAETKEGGKPSILLSSISRDYQDNSAREATNEPIIPSFGTPEDGISCAHCGFGTRRHSGHQKELSEHDK